MRVCAQTPSFAIAANHTATQRPGACSHHKPAGIGRELPSSSLARLMSKTAAGVAVPRKMEHNK